MSFGFGHAGVGCPHSLENEAPTPSHVLRLCEPRPQVQRLPRQRGLRRAIEGLEDRVRHAMGRSSIALGEIGERAAICGWMRGADREHAARAQPHLDHVVGAGDRNTIDQNDGHDLELPVMHAVYEVTHLELGNGALAARRCDRSVRCCADALRAARRASTLAGGGGARDADGSVAHFAAELAGLAALEFAASGARRTRHPLTGRRAALDAVAIWIWTRANVAARATVAVVADDVTARHSAVGQPHPATAGAIADVGGLLNLTRLQHAVGDDRVGADIDPLPARGTIGVASR